MISRLRPAGGIIAQRWLPGEAMRLAGQGRARLRRAAASNAAASGGRAILYVIALASEYIIF
jgi:hypothetical protein